MNTIAWITSKGEQHDIKDIEARRTKLNVEDLPRNVAFFINDAGYITNAVNDLINYYKKSETYSKEQIDAIVTPKLAIQIVDSLPTTEISPTTIYFLRRNKPSGTTQYESDVYDEYIYVGGTWELIGNTYVDLSDYYTKSETDDEIDSKVAIETQARTLADTTLLNNINDVQGNLNTTNQNLNAEISERQQKNLQHETSINTNATAISNEVTRATNAENTLSDRVDITENHLTDNNNPHSVTAGQIGLGNVTNVGTTNTITNDSQENITSGAVYNALENKVDKVQGKGLSDENFTYAEKTKLSGLSNYDDSSISNRVTATENAITTLNGNSSVSGSVDKKIADALGGVTQIDFQIVANLPTTGVKGVIYFVASEVNEGQNIYTEYVWVGNAYEKIGESVSTIDLTNYYTKAEVTALVSAKNDKITISDNSTALTDSDVILSGSAGANPSTMKRSALTLLFNYIKNKFGIFSRSTAGDAGWETEANRTKLPDMSFIAYWNGAYQDSSSNLAYCNKGAFGNIATKNTNASTTQYLRGDGTWATPPDTTYSVATTSANGLMSSSDKSKLNNINIDYMDIV